MAAKRLAFAHVSVSGARVLAMRGSIDLASAPRVQAALRAVAALPGLLVLDLCDVSGVVGGGAAVLCNALRRLVRAGIAMTVVCPPGPLRDELERGDLAGRIDLVADRQELRSVLSATSAVPRPPGVGPRAAGPRREDGRWKRATLARRDALLAEATLAIERRHGEPGLSLAEVAREIATSNRQLQRVFAELAGSSFRDELTAVRMQHAAALLHSTELPVGTIARQVGFRQPAQFAKAFRRHHGQTPSAFRDGVSRSAPTLEAWDDAARVHSSVARREGGGGPARPASSRPGIVAA